MEKIKGTCPIVATPFDEHNEVDQNGLKSVARQIVDDGCSAMALFGVFGEFYKLSDRERKDMIPVVADVTTGTDVDLVVTVTAESIAKAVESARYAENNGADCIMILPPSFLPTSTADQAKHIRQVCRSVDIPALLQYRPETTGAIAISKLVELYKEIDNLRYFKIETIPAGETISELDDHLGEEATILEGLAGVHMIESYDRGAEGVMPGCSMAPIYIDIHNRYLDGDISGARTLHAKLLPALNHLRQTAPMLLHYEKEILRRRGVIPSARCRNPSYSPDQPADDLFEFHYDRLKEHL
jgi:dihydrodipicolinate synthase/N-acetylneuraminate lyase